MTTAAPPRFEIIVGRPDKINKCLVEFVHFGRAIYRDRFDPYDRDETTKAMAEYIRISGREIRADVLRHEIQTAAKQGSGTDGKPIELIGIADFVRKFPNMREPIIDGLIRRGETCNVIAATKVGKSWLASDMALAVASGKPWLKRMITTQGAVIYIDLELDPETFSNRLGIIADNRELIIAELNETFFPVCLRAEGHNIHTVSNIIDQVAETGVNVSMVVLDAWYRLIPDGVSENDNAAMMSMYNRLDQYAKQLDAAFVVVHHSSKGDQSGKAVTDVGSGAGSMARAADAHIVIRPDEDEGYAVMDAACRSFPPIEPFSMYFTWPLWHVDDHHEPQLKQRKTAGVIRQTQKDLEAVDRIKKQFQETEFAVTDVRKAIGIGNDRATRILNEYGDFEEAGTRPAKRKGYDDQQLYKVKKREVD